METRSAEHAVEYHFEHVQQATLVLIAQGSNNASCVLVEIIELELLYRQTGC
ncbi:MAG TPA: hypothetical protein VIK21_00890 [Desulfuromonadaceae bacterium]|jgi:hypothetical protein